MIKAQRLRLVLLSVAGGVICVCCFNASRTWHDGEDERITREEKEREKNSDSVVKALYNRRWEQQMKANHAAFVNEQQIQRRKKIDDILERIESEAVVNQLRADLGKTKKWRTVKLAPLAVSANLETRWVPGKVKVQFSLSGPVEQLELAKSHYDRFIVELLDRNETVLVSIPIDSYELKWTRSGLIATDDVQCDTEMDYVATASWRLK